jgi:hypothetical protein
VRAAFNSLASLSGEELIQACRQAGVGVRGFRDPGQVPRSLLERTALIVLNKPGWHPYAAEFREALARRWRRRHPSAAELFAGLNETEPAEGWDGWILEAGRRFGWRPVMEGLTFHLVPAGLRAWIDRQGMKGLMAVWEAEEVPEVAMGAESTRVPANVRESAAAEADRGQPETSDTSDWKRERAALRAKIRALQEENRALQRARTAAEHRALHYQEQVERMKREIATVVDRNDWPQPSRLVQRLVSGILEARREILTLHGELAVLRAGQASPAVEERLEAEES